jgi:putative tryptophan/tyrosine transport system substrate-binding protein
MARIGILLPGAPATWSLRTNAFLDGLRELGYVEGKTIAIEWKWGDDQLDTLSRLASELVRSNVDVIVTGGTLAAQALKATTRTIPIVMAIVGDPVPPAWLIILHARAATLPVSALLVLN